jgi:hypothetical protein
MVWNQEIEIGGKRIKYTLIISTWISEEIRHNSRSLSFLRAG